MKFRDKCTVLSLREYKELQQEIEHNKETVKLFQKENNILKKEFYSLHDKLEQSEQKIDKILEIIAANKSQPSALITQIQEALGVGSSE